MLSPLRMSIRGFIRMNYRTTDYLLGTENKGINPTLEYNNTLRIMERYANNWTQEQKLTLIKILFESNN